jgi:very-short-patch-repair endonuclease
MSHLEQQFADLWLSTYPDIDLHSEYRFSPPRRYRWDFCHLESRVAIEIQGGVWMRRSGHSGGTGLVKDYQKLCLAASQGWKVFLLADSMITDEYLKLIAEAIEHFPKLPPGANIELN